MVQLLNYEFSISPFNILGFEITGGAQTMLWLAFFASFAVKMPMWPVHTWLPDAHVQAPTAGSVVLAAILLKMGGYGFLRFSLPMFPIASELMMDFVLWLSVIAIIYTSLVAMVQEDMKKLIAYSSVAHMGYVTMGIFTLNQQGIDGAIFQMISHGFISGAYTKRTLPRKRIGESSVGALSLKKKKKQTCGRRSAVSDDGGRSRCDEVML